MDTQKDLWPNSNYFTVNSLSVAMLSILNITVLFTSIYNNPLLSPTSLYSTMVINNILPDEFFPKTIHDWNNLPHKVIESDSINVFNRLL